MTTETFLPTDPKVKAALAAADQWIKILVKELDIDPADTVITVNAVGPDGKRELVKMSLAQSQTQIAAAATAWSENEQNKINDFLHHWILMLAAEMREKEQTILEILSRIDMHEKATADRVESPAYQALMRKAFRDWPGAESDAKRAMVRNLLVNAAGSRVASDDVVKLFLDWLDLYSEFHFEVIGAIYNNAGITRGGIWRALKRPSVREDSAESDLYKLLFRDLSTGGIVRQHRETDYAGNFITKRPSRSSNQMAGGKTMKSAFGDEEQYELTALGQQFVHYAMTDVPPKLNFDGN
jgi:hypothetical protein